MNGENEGRGNRRGRGGRPGRRGRGASSGRQRGPNSFRSDSNSNTATPSVLPKSENDHLSTNSHHNETGTADRKLEREESFKSDTGQELCFICASPVVHLSIAPCSHRTCHICSLRLRALYKTKACAHCRAVSDYVILTDESNNRFEDFGSDKFFNVDSGLGIKYDTKEVYEESLLLLRYNCPEPTCDVACLGWPDLHRHVRTVHKKAMCDLCTRHKKVFTHEHELFTKEQIRKHERFGDDNPGAVDQSGFRGHPECGFCRQRFYSDDELYVHCRNKHERCHICESQAQGRQHPYYLDYDALEEHFRKDHFLCADKECLEKKFVVFGSAMDLKAHQLEVHPNDLSKEARRDARRVDISDFAYRNAQHDARGGRRNGRNRGRGRDPNAEAPISVGLQPRRRDEVAFQRQLAIQSAQSVTTRTFAGQLTVEPDLARPASAQSNNAKPLHNPVEPTHTDEANKGTSKSAKSTSMPSASTLSPQDKARSLRHNAVIERAANMLRNDQQKLGNFSTKVSSYRNSEMTATNLISSFFSLFDTSSVELGKLINELAEIFEISSKRDSLLKAWADWKAINEDYPTLPGSNSETRNEPNRSLDHGGSRVLKLKSSTAQSSRSSISRQAGWGDSSVATTANNSFPTLPPPSSNTNSKVLNSNIRAGPSNTLKKPYWPGAASASAPASASSVSTSSPTARLPIRSASPSVTSIQRNTSTLASKNNSNNRNNEGAFPALPTAAKPASSAFVPGLGSRAVRHDTKADNVARNVWMMNGSANADAGLASDAGLTSDDGADGADGASWLGAEAGGGAVGNSRAKKGKNKKQMLFHFG